MRFGQRSAGTLQNRDTLGPQRASRSLPPWVSRHVPPNHEFPPDEPHFFATPAPVRAVRDEMAVAGPNHADRVVGVAQFRHRAAGPPLGATGGCRGELRSPGARRSGRAIPVRPGVRGTACRARAPRATVAAARCGAIVARPAGSDRLADAVHRHMRRPSQASPGCCGC